MRKRQLSILILLVVTCWALAGLSRLAPGLQPGLRAQYFVTTDWSGDPARVGIDPEISTEQLSRAWGFRPADVYSARWSGYLFVDRAGDYLFRLTSDDGSDLTVDGRVVVDNGGVHGDVTRDGRIRLEAGTHPIVIRYSQAGGPYRLEWEWAHENDQPSRVAAWRLAPRVRSYRSLLALRILDVAWPLLTIVVLLLAGPAAVRLGWLRRDERTPERGAPQESQGTPERGVLQKPRGAPGWAALLFVVLACVHTWPLVTNPAHLSRNDNADTILNEWTIAWIAHQLPRNPLHLFEGNQFYPERHSIALSEALLVQSVMAAPLLWLGASPVLAYNVVLLAGFVLTGWATFLVVARWTGDSVAGVVAGIIVAFNAHTLTRLPHLQAQHAEFLPLALLALDALLRRPRWSAAVWLGICVALQAYASIYLLVFTAVALAVAVFVRPEDWMGTRFKDIAPRLGLAAVVAGLAVLPLLMPYFDLRSEGFTRSLDEVGYYAASPRDYATSPSRFHAMARGTAALFPGTMAIALALLTLALGVAFRDARARMCLAIGISGVVLSFGPAVAPGYEFFHSTVPLLQGIRAASRFGYLGIFAIAILAGYGVALLRKPDGLPARAVQSISVVLVLLVALEPLAAPILFQRFDRIPSIYRLPADDPQAVVAEMPFYRPESQFRNAPYLLNSTLNWKPLLNGYSGFIPPSYVEHFLAFNGFPADDAIEAVRRAGVTHLFVHLDQYDADKRAAIARAPQLRRVAEEGTIVLYRLN